MIDIKKYIIEKSKELDIDIIGFTDSSPLLNIKDYIKYRKDNNIQSEFEEKDLQKRIDPKCTFKDCKSIIVIGISYNVDFRPGEGIKLKGSLSKSSWGIDYHRVLRKKMEELIKEIERIIDFKYEYFVDTGPMIDRELARKAGVGYYGKNCSIINKEYGSFIFLGYILSDLDIETNSYSTIEDCGDCQICLKSCPTGALEGPYKLNPKKCISYLTQTKDIIPEELRKKMGINIYGCDTCQSVCPKNKGVKLSRHKEFLPIDTKGVIDIEEIFIMSNRQFKEKYGSMSGSWRGKNILKRNAIIALGNMKSKDNIQLLYKEESKDNPALKQYIKWSISNILSKKSQDNK
ncbi:tRNA epoxyqueuosine(34) reductase QueG [Wansuia hejianensis]|uniref:tRNA epoxyqueuosine(34) reductase QueG n=1 Tax=Wansuia hejianensis TaxID=2763667 RepID=UPI0020165114